MNILADLLEFLFHPDLAPETPWGWLMLSLIYGVVVSGGLLYALVESPSSAGTAIFLAFLGAPLGILFAGLHAIREPSDRWLATCTIIANSAAVVLALVLWQ